jgi:hypothetical protein
MHTSSTLLGTTLQIVIHGIVDYTMTTISKLFGELEFKGVNLSFLF